MASFLVKDAYTLMNSLMRQASAQTDLTATDHTSFIDCGKKLLDTGTENVLNAVYRTIAKVDMQVRDYSAKLGLINATDTQFNSRKAKISFYSDDSEAAGPFNTDLNPDNITNGGRPTDGAGDMWTIKTPRVVERFFLSEEAYDKHWTTFLVQLQSAFNDEATFTSFMNAVLTVIRSDMEQTLEGRRRMLINDRIAGTYLQVQRGVLGPECAVDFTAYFQEKTGTQYTYDEITTEHLTELSELVTAKIQIDAKRMGERTTKYHDPMTITDNGVDYNVLRHTPMDKIKTFYFGEFWKEAEARVMPHIFNTSYIAPERGEDVGFWQSSKNDSRMKVSCKPALPDGAESEEVTLDHVLFLVFDEDALESINQYEGTFTSPIEAKKLYYNTFVHYKWGAINDYTENGIVYYMSQYGKYQNKDNFAGDGTETDFVLTKSATKILSVTVNGTEKVETTDYTFDADTNTITFTSAPANKAKIVVDYVWTE